MRRFINTKVIVILVAAIAITSVSALTVSRGNTGTDVLTSTVRATAEPGDGLVSSLVSKLEGLYGYLYKYDQLAAENEELRTRVAMLEKENREHADVFAENDRLRQLLEMKERGSEYELCSASVISWTASNWGSAFVIDRGADDGIEVGDAVMTELSYAVGRVTSVTAGTATVTTIIDTSSSVGATVHKTGDSAVAQGDFSLMEKGLLKLSFLPEGVQLLAGDTVVSSGRGGVYPKGLVIGTVTDVVTSSSGAGDYAVLKPAAQLDSLMSVHVITGNSAAE